MSGAAFGAAVLARPGLSLETVALAFGGFAVVDGTLGVLSALDSEGRDAWSLGVDGALGIAGGLVVFAWPGVGATTFLGVVVAWAALRGGTELWVARSLRRQCPHDFTLPAAALLALAYAAALVAHPDGDVATIGRETAVAAAATGVLLAVLGLRLGHWLRESRRLERMLVGRDPARAGRTA